MSYKKKNLERLKASLLTLSILTTGALLSGCDKHDEVDLETNHVHKGACVIVDEENNEVKVIEDNTITGMRVIKK